MTRSAQLAPSGTEGALNVDTGTMLARPESKAPIIMLITNTMKVHTTGTWLMINDDVLYSIRWNRQSRSKLRDRNITPINTLRGSSIKKKKQIIAFFFFVVIINFYFINRTPVRITAVLTCKNMEVAISTSSGL